MKSHSRIVGLKLFGKAVIGARERHHRVRLDGDLVEGATIAITHAQMLVLAGPRIAESEEIAHGNVFVQIEGVVVDHELKRARDVDVRRRRRRGLRGVWAAFFR